MSVHFQMYGTPYGLASRSPRPVVAQKAPNSSTDLGYDSGTIWCDQSGNNVYTALKSSGGTESWVLSGGLTALVTSNSTPATNNAIIGQVTFTGFTTASGASEILVIQNSLISGVSQPILVTVTNAGSNDAQMTISRLALAAGTLTLTLKNNGAAALNGNIYINFQIQS